MLMLAGFRLVLVCVLFALVTIPLFPFQMFAVQLKRFWFQSLPCLWHKCMCVLLGLHIDVKGSMSTERPLMLVSNHVSWSDVLVLGSLAHVSFIAKSEVAGWPLFGMLAKLQRTQFVDRKNKQKAGEQAQEIARRLAAGDVLVLFPEGTTSDGNRILPFKSSLFGAAKMALDAQSKQAQVFIQPVAIAYTKRHGIPLGRYHRPIAGWPGTVTLLSHVRGLVGAASISVDVTFGTPIMFNHQVTRKQVCQNVEAAVKQMHEASIYPAINHGHKMEQAAQISSITEPKRVKRLS